MMVKKCSSFWHLVAIRENKKRKEAENRNNINIVMID
jgi:hypothetical protein